MAAGWMTVLAVVAPVLALVVFDVRLRATVAAARAALWPDGSVAASDALALHEDVALWMDAREQAWRARHEGLERDLLACQRNLTATAADAEAVAIENRKLRAVAKRSPSRARLRVGVLGVLDGRPCSEARRLSAHECGLLRRNEQAFVLLDAVDEACLDEHVAELCVAAPLDGDVDLAAVCKRDALTAVLVADGSVRRCSTWALHVMSAVEALEAAIDARTHPRAPVVEVVLPGSAPGRAVLVSCRAVATMQPAERGEQLLRQVDATDPPRLLYRRQLVDGVTDSPCLAALRAEAVPPATTATLDPRAVLVEFAPGQPDARSLSGSVRFRY